MILYRIFEDVAKQFPDKAAVISASGSISYKELNTKANHIAHALTRLNPGRQSIVGIYLSAGIQYIAATIGIMKSQMVFMPVSTQYPAKRLGFLLERTTPHIIITGRHLKDDLLLKLNQSEIDFKPHYLLCLDENLGFDVVAQDGKASITPGHEYPDQIISGTDKEEDACYIITTSGSTGAPKAILGTHKGLSHFINWEVSEFNLTEHERVSLLSPVTFDVSLRDIFVPLSLGGTLCIPDEAVRSNPRKLTQWLREAEISVVHIIPTLLRLVTEEVESFSAHENIFPTLKYALTAGEVLYWTDVERWRKSVGGSVELANLYGPSETTLAKLFYRVADRDSNSKESGSVPLGRPIPDTEVFIINDGNKCPVGATGEIYIKTDFRSRGYYNAPEMNRMSFVQNPLVADREDIVYKTGDLGEYLPDGCVKFSGRIDNQIKLHGVRIEPTEIESVLNQHNQVRQSAVSAIDDAFGNKQLAAYIVPKTGENPTVESLRRFIEQKIPDFMIPTLFINIEVMPVTHNGKIDRAALPSPPRIRPEMDEVYAAPSSELEQTLCKIWMRVLNIDKVGIYDNFFYLGGTSLLIVRASELIGSKLKIDLPVAKMFEYPKIIMLARYLSGKLQEDISHTHARIGQRSQKHKESISRIKHSKNRN